MTANPLKLVGAFALLTCLGAAVGAQAQTEVTPERPSDDAPARKDDPVLARADQSLMLRLERLETERRKNRRLALQDPEAWAAGRAQRRTEHRQEIAQVWGNVVNSIDGQAKLRLHAERMSRLNRMLDLAEQANDKTLIVQVRVDIRRELVRHANAMQATIAASGAP
jgi:hypothetical protein